MTLLLLALPVAIVGSAIGVAALIDIARRHRRQPKRLVDHFVQRRRWTGAMLVGLLLASPFWMTLWASLGSVGFLGGGLSIAAAIAVITFCSRSSEDAVLTALRRAGGGLCPHCGYQLEPTMERCPECGSPGTAEGASITWQDRLGEIGERI